MKENLTELVFILDRSGSMGGLESDTIGGYNAMLSKQKNQSGSAKVTTVLFDDEYETILFDASIIAALVTLFPSWNWSLNPLNKVLIKELCVSCCFPKTSLVFIP